MESLADYDRDNFRCSCGWEIAVVRGYSIPSPFRPVKCKAGHYAAWSFRRLSRRLSWRCSIVLSSADGLRCGAEESEPLHKGFLSGKPVAPAYLIKDWILLAVYECQQEESPAHIQNLRRHAPNLSDGQLRGGLARSLKTGHLVRLDRVVLPVGGFAFEYGLTERGEDYLMAKSSIISAVITAQRPIADHK